jgi:hypothetical protein
MGLLNQDETLRMRGGCSEVDKDTDCEFLEVVTGWTDGHRARACNDPQATILRVAWRVDVGHRSTRPCARIIR